MLLIIGAVMFFMIRTRAQSSKPLQGLAISPSLVERDANPGEVVNLNAKISNFDTKGVTLYISTADFEADPNEGGQPRFISSQNESDNPRSVSRWIKLSTSKLFIGTGERQEISYTVTVPANAEPGSHYGALIFSREDPTTVKGSGVGATSEVGTLVFVKVAGETVERGGVVSFGTTRFWYENPPAFFQIRFRNNGNVQVKPTGLLQIYNSAGIKEEVIQINKRFNSVLPDSTRKLEEQWDPGKWFGVIPRIGRYKADGILIYGIPSKTIKLGEIYFWFVPWRFILTVIGSLMAVILGFMLFLRLYAKMAIAKYAKQQGRNK